MVVATCGSLWGALGDPVGGSDMWWSDRCNL